MRYQTKYFVSPSFTHEKLEPPFLRDVIDVFEDRMRHWLIAPAKQLLDVQHGDVAAVALAINYFEGIEIYITGEDSDRKSKAFFCRGFMRVFPGISGPVELQQKIAETLYDLLRCGFAHDALFRKRIHFSTARPEPILVTWPRKNGVFLPDGDMESAVINPRSFVAGVERHLDSYVRKLNSKGEPDLLSKFKVIVDLKWGLTDAPPAVGLSEQEFWGGSESPRV